jgi:hypothetical protein
MRETSVDALGMGEAQDAPIMKSDDEMGGV